MLHLILHNFCFYNHNDMPWEIEETFSQKNSLGGPGIEPSFSVINRQVTYQRHFSTFYNQLFSSSLTFNNITLLTPLIEIKYIPSFQNSSIQVATFRWWPGPIWSLFTQSRPRLSHAGITISIRSTTVIDTGHVEHGSSQQQYLDGE